MSCVLIYAVCFPPYIEFSHIYCALLHVLFFLVYIVYCFMSYAWLHLLCSASCLTLNSMYCVLCHALCLTPWPVCCVMPCAWPPCLRAVSCLVLDSMPVCCVVSCLVLDPMSVCHSIYPILLHACQVSFWTYICFFKIIYPKFLWLTIRYPYFPFLLDIKSLTLLVYVQFSSDSIPFSHTLSLILDISCHFLFFISNFYPVKFVFHLHRPWLWIFPAIFS